jgi:hypothetical protein
MPRSEAIVARLLDQSRVINWQIGEWPEIS